MGSAASPRRAAPRNSSVTKLGADQTASPAADRSCRTGDGWFSSRWPQEQVPARIGRRPNRRVDRSTSQRAQPTARQRRDTDGRWRFRPATCSMRCRAHCSTAHGSTAVTPTVGGGCSPATVLVGVLGVRVPTEDPRVRPCTSSLKQWIAGVSVTGPAGAAANASATLRCGPTDQAGVTGPADGAARRTTLDPRVCRRDGRFAAIAVAAPRACRRPDVWIYDLGRRNSRTRLTSSPITDQSPVWSAGPNVWICFLGWSFPWVQDLGCLAAYGGAQELCMIPVPPRSVSPDGGHVTVHADKRRHVERPDGAAAVRRAKTGSICRNHCD